MMSADAAVERTADRVRGGLAGQIDFQRAVDGDHVVLLGDFERVVRIIDRPKENGGVVVRGIRRFLSSPCEKAATVIPGFSFFLRIVDDSGLDQVHEAIAEQFGMHPQMLFVEQVGHDRIRQPPVTDLDGIAVLNEAGHVVADPLCRFIERNGRKLQEGFVMADDEIDILDVDEPVAMNTGHVGVHLCDDHGCLVRGGFDHIHADSETQISVLIGKRSLDKRHIDLYRTAFDQGRHVGKGDGGVVGQSLVYGAAGVVSDKERVETEIALEFWIGIRRYAEGIDMDDLRVEKCLGVGFNVIDHRTDKVLGFTAPRGDEDMIATADVTENDIFLGELFRVQFFPVIQRSHLAFLTDPKRLITWFGLRGKHFL